MRYILYSPEHEQTVPAIRKTDGTTIPTRTFTVGARALYRLKDLPNRRYRRDYPSLERNVVLLKRKTYEEAKQEREALKDYSGEEFEIHEYENGQVGPKVVECRL